MSWRKRSVQDAAQYVRRHVEVVCNALADDASFSDLDLGHASEPDLWRHTPELKLLEIRLPVDGAVQEESELAPTDCSSVGESVPQQIKILVQRPAGEASDERIGEPIARDGRSEDLVHLGLCPTF